MSPAVWILAPPDLEGAARLAAEAGYSAYGVAALEARLGSARFLSLVVGSAPSGLALFGRADSEAELHLLVIDPASRRRGLGGRLLDAGLARLAGVGVTTVFLEVSERNAAARALYAGRGFSEAGRRRGYYPDGADALLLRCDLGSGSRPL